jgi:hypothetical protein
MPEPYGKTSFLNKMYFMKTISKQVPFYIDNEFKFLIPKSEEADEPASPGGGEPIRGQIKKFYSKTYY